MQNTRFTLTQKFIMVAGVLWMVALTVYSKTILAESSGLPNPFNQTAVVSLVAPDTVRSFLEKHIKLPEEPFPSDMAQRAFLRRTKHDIKELLSTQGYFSSTVTLDKQVDKESEIPVINVDPGPLAHVESVRLEFQGEITQEDGAQKKIKAWRKNWPLKASQPFRSAEWEEAKTVLISQVTYEKYAAASIVKSEAVVDKDNALVTLHVVIDSGPVFYFGELEVTGLERYKPELIENYRPFRSGDPYRKELMQIFQIALQGIPHFSNVSVNIYPDVSNFSAVPVHVAVTETKSQRIAIGGGYSSNNGARAELNFSNHNFLDRAWNFNTTLRLEQKRQTFFTGVNTLPNRNNIYYSTGASLQRTDIEDLVTVKQRVDVARVYQTRNVQRHYSLNWQREEKRPAGAINQTNQALALDWQFRHHVIDNPVNIRRGTVTELRFGGGTEFALSDQNFLRMYGRQQNWWPVGKRDVFHLRGEAGYTLAPSRFGIPQEYLFRAGGIQSIRGYDFLSIGVREGEATVGGRVLATGTAEYTHWFMQNWGAAAFADAGSAADSVQDMDLFLGYGAGIRWRSPAGPLALDLARAHKTGTFRVHFSLAVNF